MRIVFVFFFSLAVVFPSGAHADPVALPQTCMNAARAAEARHGIPHKLLQAITLVETGRGAGENLYAWPWTVNVNKNGRYFASKSETHAFINQTFRSGEQSIDIGCFQINFKWHGKHFNSTLEMLDPEHGAEYAAEFLSKLKDELGDWNAAAAAYHSRDHDRGRRYAAKLTKTQSHLQQQKTTAPFAVVPPPLRDIVPERFAGGVALTAFTDRPPIVEETGADLLGQMGAK